MFGSIMCLLPSGYIIIVLIFNQNQHQHQVTNESVAIEQINQIRNIIEEIDMTETRNDPYNDRTDDDTEIVIASGCSFQETSIGEL